MNLLCLTRQTYVILIHSMKMPRSEKIWGSTKFYNSPTSFSLAMQTYSMRRSGLPFRYSSFSAFTESQLTESFTGLGFALRQCDVARPVPTSLHEYYGNFSRHHTTLGLSPCSTPCSLTNLPLHEAAELVASRVVAMPPEKALVKKHGLAFLCYI